VAAERGEEEAGRIARRRVHAQDRPEDLSDDEVWKTYSLLTRVEAAFRSMKSPLAERPIFHHLKERVQTHIFLCVLAYHLLVAVEKTLRDAGLYTSWGTVREELATHQVVTVNLPTSDGNVLSIRRATAPEPTHKKLYDLLRISSDIIKACRTLRPTIVTQARLTPQHHSIDSPRVWKLG